MEYKRITNSRRKLEKEQEIWYTDDQKGSYPGKIIVALCASDEGQQYRVQLEDGRNIEVKEEDLEPKEQEHQDQIDFKTMPLPKINFGENHLDQTEFKKCSFPEKMKTLTPDKVRRLMPHWKPTQLTERQKELMN